MSDERIAGEIASSCLCRRARALSRKVTALYDQALRRAGVTANQLTILVAVQRAGEISPSQLGERLAMEKSTVSRTLARMAESGWLTSEVVGRGRSVSLTGSGRERIRAAHGAWRGAQEQTRERLGVELAEALRLVDRL